MFGSTAGSGMRSFIAGTLAPVIFFTITGALTNASSPWIGPRWRRPA